MLEFQDVPRRCQFCRAFNRDVCLASVVPGSSACEERRLLLGGAVAITVDYVAAEEKMPENTTPPDGLVPWLERIGWIIAIPVTAVITLLLRWRKQRAEEPLTAARATLIKEHAYDHIYNRMERERQTSEERYTRHIRQLELSAERREAEHRTALGEKETEIEMLSEAQEVYRGQLHELERQKGALVAERDALRREIERNVEEKTLLMKQRDAAKAGITSLRTRCQLLQEELNEKEKENKP